MRRVRHVVTEIDRVTWFVALLDAGEVAPVGTADERVARVAARRLRGVLPRARPGGRAPPARPVPLGARMTGGGFGGSAIALVDADEVDRVAQAVADAFADAGPARARRSSWRRRPPRRAEQVIDAIRYSRMTPRQACAT